MAADTCGAIRDRLFAGVAGNLARVAFAGCEVVLSRLLNRQIAEHNCSEA